MPQDGGDVQGRVGLRRGAVLEGRDELSLDRIDRQPEPLERVGAQHVEIARIAEEADRVQGASLARRGKLVGFFLPSSGSAVPLEIKRDLFYALTDGIRRLTRAKGLSEEALVADFRATKPARRRR